MLAPNTDIQSVLQADAGSRRKRLFRRPLIWLLIVLAAVGGLLWWTGRAGEPALTYKTAPVTRGALTITVAATGTVEPINQVEVSSELSGILRTVKVDYNDRVRAGDMLAEINTDKLTAQANRARALSTRRVPMSRRAKQPSPRPRRISTGWRCWSGEIRAP